MASPAPIFEPQSSADELADHACRVQLVEGPAGLVFPPLCPNCGHRAAGRLSVRKVFRQPSGNDSPDDYLIRSLDVPYCEDCMALHRQALLPLGWAQIAAVSLADGLSISAVGCALMAMMLLPAALASLFRPGFPLPVLVVLGFSAIAWSSASGAWRQTAHRRVRAQTEVTRAFDFTDPHGDLFESHRATYSIRNPAFAEAFRALNCARVWDPHSPAATRAAQSRKGLLIVVACIVMVVLMWDLLKRLIGT